MANMINVLGHYGIVTEATTVRWAPSDERGGQLAHTIAGAMSAVRARHVMWVDAWATHEAWDAVYDWGVYRLMTDPVGGLVITGYPLHRAVDEPGLAVLVVGYSEDQDDKRGLIGRFVCDVVDKRRVVAARLVTLAVGVTADEWAAARADALTIAAHLER